MYEKGQWLPWDVETTLLTDDVKPGHLTAQIFLQFSGELKTSNYVA